MKLPRTLVPVYSSARDETEWFTSKEQAHHNISVIPRKKIVTKYKGKKADIHCLIHNERVYYFNNRHLWYLTTTTNRTWWINRIINESFAQFSYIHKVKNRLTIISLLFLER